MYTMDGIGFLLFIANLIMLPLFFTAVGSGRRTIILFRLGNHQRNIPIIVEYILQRAFAGSVS